MSKRGGGITKQRGRERESAVKEIDTAKEEEGRDKDTHRRYIITKVLYIVHVLLPIAFRDSQLKSDKDTNRIMYRTTEFSKITNFYF